MLTAIILILFALILVLDYLPGFKSRVKRANFVYAFFLAVSLCVLLLYSLDVPIPGPTRAIQAAAGKVFTLLGGQDYGK